MLKVRSTICICFFRSNTSKVLNEFSALTWTSEIAKTDLYVQQQPYDNITGYISGVEYFSIKNQIYVVACRYYDPVLDTHDLDCMVMKISKMTVSVKFNNSIINQNLKIKI